MYIIVLGQDELMQVMASVASEQEAINLIEVIPQVQKQIWEDEVYYEIDPNDLAPYAEILYHGWKLPISQLAFRPDEIIDVYYIKVPDVSQPGQGAFVDGMTKVDAYLIPNGEVADYIKQREALAEAALAYYRNLGYEVERRYQGSQDGEAISVHDGEDLLALIHLNPEEIRDFQVLGSEHFFAQWLTEE